MSLSFFARMVATIFNPGVIVSIDYHNNEMKILILCSYFQRPKLVRNALSSILAANEHHQDWEMAFGDDGSDIPGKPIVEEMLKDHLEKVTFVHSGMTLEDKLKKGLMLGKMANEAIAASSADVAFVLCDDDEIHPEYMKNLSLFYEKNPSILYAYSKIHLYNPLFQKSAEVNNLNHKYNQWTVPINPCCKVDASQVSWRLSCCKDLDAWFVDSTKFVSHRPWSKDTDRSFFENLYNKCGDCHPTNIIGQYKGVHEHQLLWHKDVGVDQLKEYTEMCKELGGIEF